MEYQIKEIPNFPGYYADTEGNIFSCYNLGNHKIEDRIHRRLKPAKTTANYLFVSLYHNKEIKRKTIHRLILETFIGPCPDGMECCHNNGIKTDNRLGNLRWDTSSNNHKDRVRHGTMNWGENSGTAKLTEMDVRVIRRLIEFDTISQAQIAKIFDICPMQISRIKHKQRWHHI